MTISTIDSTVAAPAIPSLRTFRNLFIGGYCALMAWEIWARTITAWVVGGPLEPPELVRSLVQHWTHIDLPLSTATFIHYAVGIFGYPIAYYVDAQWTASVGNVFSRHLGDFRPSALTASFGFGLRTRRTGMTPLQITFAMGTTRFDEPFGLGNVRFFIGNTDGL